MFSSPFSFDLHKNTAGIKVTFNSDLYPFTSRIPPTFNAMYYGLNYDDEPLVEAGTFTKFSKLCWIADHSSNKKVGMISLLTVGSSHINKIHLVLDYCENPKLEGHELCF